MVQVNSQLQTSNPDVYAVGDIAAFPLTMYGGEINRQEHVVNARSVELPAWAQVNVAGHICMVYAHHVHFASCGRDHPLVVYGIFL